ncbi:dermonecrotic toxin domain-containing protein [Pseudomonas sp.]|uniref:dermonecrotic toxin domain-containing protein n=1 Tax=Pseudomonas sp. TaxID=306 RepID=UPI003C74E834
MLFRGRLTQRSYLKLEPFPHGLPPKTTPNRAPQVEITTMIPSTALSPPQLPATHGQPDAQSPNTSLNRTSYSTGPKEQQLVTEMKPEASRSGVYVETAVDPDPGKRVANSEKTPVPVNVGLNINIDPVAKKISQAFNSVEQEASLFLKDRFAKMKAQETDPDKKQKWDIDPDNTYLVTYDYNSQDKEPYPAKITEKISLTQALIKNAQDTPQGSGYSVAFFNGGPNVKVQDQLETHKPGIFDFSSRFDPHNPRANITHSYQGIYSESPGSPASLYNATNQSALAPDDFKKLIWKADFQKPYESFLDEFWNSHQEKYAPLAKAAFIKSAMGQHQEGSLSAAGRTLVMRAAGLPGNQDSWPDIKFEDIQKNSAKDPNIDVGLLNIGQYSSTDLVYITDKSVKLDAHGNKIPPLTLLYIPGNSSPIHSFNSPAEMKTWIAKQMADPAKQTAMASHFQLKDKPNGWERAGIDETLAGLGAWPAWRETPGLYGSKAFSGKWDPQDFITTEPYDRPFDEVSKRQKDRSYADAAIKITSDRDVTKTHILEGLEKTAKAAMFLTPLSLVVPEVAAALDLFYLADALTTAGIGVDDALRGKDKGTDRIVFGLFNAATVVVPHAISKLRGRGRFKPGESPRPAPRTEEPVPLEKDNAPIRTKTSGRLNDLKDLLGSSNSIHAKFKPFASKYRTTGEFQPDRWGVYKIKGEPYVTIKADGSGGTALYKVRLNAKQNIELVKPGEFVSNNAPQLREVGNGEFREIIDNHLFAKRLKGTLKKGPLRDAYEKGLASGDPTKIKGYKKGLAYDQIQALIMQPERTPEEIGTLVAVLKKQEVTYSLDQFLAFKGDVEAAGGTAVGMPQSFYIHEISKLNEGECAALANTMALAIEKNREGVLIENLFKSTAPSKDAAIVGFRKNMKNLQKATEYHFHGSQPSRQVPYTDIASELDKAVTTKILRIRDNGHGIIAGTTIKNGEKSFFLYDPNYGLARFPSKESMEKGLDSLLSSGSTAGARRPMGTNPELPEYDISEFSEQDFMQVAQGVDPNEFFDAPL